MKPRLALVLLSLLGCSPHTVTERPTAPVRLPQSYTADRGQGQPPEHWWRSFRSPELTQLIEASLRNNFDLRGAWARLAQAAAAADQAGAPRWPTLDLNVGAGLTRRQFNFPGLPNQFQTLSSASGSLAASYEVDLWKRLSSTARAAALDRDAAADAVETMAMSVAAEVADLWLSLIEVRARREVLEEQLKTNETFVELLKVRFGQGLSSSVEVTQQKQQAIEARGLLELTVSDEAVIEHRIALLLGKPAGQLTLDPRDSFPELPPLPGAGVPAELLKRRPDIRAAQRRVEAADHRVAAAIADRYPRLSLTGSLSSEPAELNDWALNPIWTLAANLALPIIDGGRRAAEVDRQRAVMSELVASYGTTVLTALLEVENALSLEEQQRKQLVHIEEQVEVAGITFEEAKRRYEYGLSDFLTVLTALRSRNQIQLGLLSAKRQLLSHRVQLCRALGGTWTAALEPPEPARSEDATEAQARDEG